MQSASQLFDPTDRAAIVTGGAVGIGEMIARRLSEAGVVLVADQDLEHVDLAVQGMRALGGRAQALRAELTEATWDRVLSVNPGSNLVVDGGFLLT